MVGITRRKYFFLLFCLLSTFSRMCGSPLTSCPLWSLWLGRWPYVRRAALAWQISLPNLWLWSLMCSFWMLSASSSYIRGRWPIWRRESRRSWARSRRWPSRPMIPRHAIRQSDAAGRTKFFLGLCWPHCCFSIFFGCWWSAFQGMWFEEWFASSCDFGVVNWWVQWAHLWLKGSFLFWLLLSWDERYG